VDDPATAERLDRLAEELGTEMEARGG
jgi:hypothetical protein